MNEHVSAESPVRWGAGMVLVRDTQELRAETYTQELIAGIDQAISPAGGTLLLKVVADEAAERRTYQHWASEGHIQWVLLEEFTLDDTRRPFLESLGLDVVVIADLEMAGSGPAVLTDNEGTTRLAVEALHAAGHRSIGRVSGPDRFRHSRAREEAFAESGAQFGVATTVAPGDYSFESGYAAVEALLAGSGSVTALLFDNDLMALGGLAALRKHGKSVPDDMSIVAWDDSVRCQMTVPPLAALSHDVREIGEMAGNALIAARGDRVLRAQAPPPTLVTRGSLGPPPSA